MLKSCLSFSTLCEAVKGPAAAFRVVTRLQPVGGPSDKIFPATYESGKYATEKRQRLNKDGQCEPMDCVLIDSVQSQANRLEQALLSAHRRRGGTLDFPLLVVDFAKYHAHVGEITSLDASHRVADAVFRDSLHGGKPFRDSEDGKSFSKARTANATPLYRLCPHALIFGLWDSAGPQGGMGAKFARVPVSEIIGLDAVPGQKTSSKIDSLAIATGAGPIYLAKDGGWTFDEKQAKEDGKKGVMKVGKEGKPSEINHGNVTPDLVFRKDKNQNLILDENRRPIPVGGFTISEAVQTTVLSLPGLRRLRFPLKDGQAKPESDHAAQTVLAALALVAIARQRQDGYDLRSRCQLVPTHAPDIELVPADGSDSKRFALDSKGAEDLLAEALTVAKKAGLTWIDQPIVLEPSSFLVELVQRSIDARAQDQEAKE